MDLKQAREILKYGLVSGVDDKNPDGYSQYAQGCANGFREAHEQSQKTIKILTEALEQAICDCVGQFPIKKHDKDCMNLVAKEALERVKAGR